MFTFYCIAKTAAKTKTNFSLQIGVPKKQRLYPAGLSAVLQSYVAVAFLQL